LTQDGQPRRRAGRERTYPEFLQSRRCRLVVLAFETGGRWSHETTNFIRLLAQSKARQAPALLQPVMAALISRWSALLRHAAMQSFAASLLDQDQNLSTHSNVDGNAPPVSQLLAETPPPPLGNSRLPPS